MKYLVEENLRNFQAWEGGKNTLEHLIDLGDEALNKVEQLIEETFSETPTDGQINDFLWFETERITEHLGLGLDWEEPTELTDDYKEFLEVDMEEEGKEEVIKVLQGLDKQYSNEEEIEETLKTFGMTLQRIQRDVKKYELLAEKTISNFSLCVTFEENWKKDGLKLNNLFDLDDNRYSEECGIGKHTLFVFDVVTDWENEHEEEN